VAEQTKDAATGNLQVDVTQSPKLAVALAETFGENSSLLGGGVR
jgi:hypothetical protein